MIAMKLKKYNGFLLIEYGPTVIKFVVLYPEIKSVLQSLPETPIKIRTILTNSIARLSTPDSSILCWLNKKIIKIGIKKKRVIFILSKSVYFKIGSCKLAIRKLEIKTMDLFNIYFLDFVTSSIFISMN